MSAFSILPLTKDQVIKYKEDIICALDQIPKTDKHDLEKLLSEKKGDRVLYAKWEHSLIMLSPNAEFIGVAIGYERKAEGNRQYPRDCIYLNDFAINSKFQKQGYGHILLEKWLDHNKKMGLKHSSSLLHFAVQTNSAVWNKHVQRLYESAGFKKISEKKYENRVDSVLLL